MRIGVIIPALNEDATVEGIVRRCLAQRRSPDEMRVVVCDNGSHDRTAEAARSGGAEVASEPYRGYGAACLRAIAHLGAWPDVLVFIDADGSSLPEELDRLLSPIIRDQADMVLGRRHAAPGSMTPPQKFGTWLAVFLIQLRWRVHYDDLGPFRAIRRDSLERLAMTDRTWGWTIEMQILAILRHVRWLEVDVSWARRLAGQSKISGTLKGVLRTGAKILWTIARYSFCRVRR